MEGPKRGRRPGPRPVAARRTDAGAAALACRGPRYFELSTPSGSPTTTVTIFPGRIRRRATRRTSSSVIASKIAGRICFSQGKTDVYVDGRLEEKPNTRWD